MSKALYLKSRVPFLLVNFFCMILASMFLLAVGNSTGTVILLLSFWIFVLAAGLFISCMSRSRQMKKLLETTKNLEERYLIPELMPAPKCAEDRVYYEILKLAERAALERIGDISRERSEYKEYIEQWVHEIKTPVTALKLLCENHRSDITRELLTEVESINRCAQQALYYARSEHTEKDYLIREMSISRVVHQAVRDNKYLLLGKQVSVEVEDSKETVYSDDKWVRFILNQLIGNAVKYSGEHPCIEFYTQRENNQVVLYVKDNGRGIPLQDLPRIFEKGFTGENGRRGNNSTGMGLYLCKRLCDRLDIKIQAETGETGTVLSLTFRMNHYIHQVRS